MAYGSVISLMHTTQHLLNSHNISIGSSSIKSVESTYKEADSLLEALKRLDGSSRRGKRVKALDGEIREAVSKLEDVLESHLLYEESESCSLTLSIDAEEEIHSLVETAKKMTEEYINELENPLTDEEDDDYAVSIAFDGKRSSIFGLSDDKISRIKGQLTWRSSFEFRIVAVVGMRSISRNIFGKLVCEELSFDEFADDCAIAMVTIGAEYVLKDILIGILSQVVDEMPNWEEEDEKLLGERLYTSLAGRIYLIVLNDIWYTEVWDFLRISFPRQHNGSRVFLTTRLMEIARFADIDEIYEMKILNDVQNWDFIHELDPSLFEPRDGEKIARIKLFLPEFKDDASDERLTEIFTIAQDLESGNWFFDDGDVVSRNDPAETIAQMIELFQDVDRIMQEDVPQCESHWPLYMYCLFGMAGIGKTTLAREIFEDPTIVSHFDIRVWVTFSPKYRSENILADILAQIDPNIDKMRMMKGDDMLAKHFWTAASCRRCLIVLDDVWSKDALRYLEKLYKVFKFEGLLTTSLQEVADFFERICCC